MGFNTPIFLLFLWVAQRAASNFSIEACARKHDIGRNYEPEGVVAHDLYFDEHAKDR
jgi:hypothetical protein